MYMFNILSLEGEKMNFRKFISLGIIIIMLISLASCKSKDKENAEVGETTTAYYNPFETDKNDKNDEEINAQFSFGANEKELIYYGKELELNYEINNSDIPCETGLIFYINGIIQKYTTSESKDVRYMHYFNLKKQENKKIKIYIKPSVGRSGETLVLSDSVVLNPSYHPNEDVPVFGNNVKLEAGGNIYVKFNTDANAEEFTVLKDLEEKELPKEIKEQIKNKELNIDQNNYLFFKRLDESKNCQKAYFNNNSLTFEINAFGKKGITYNLYFFINNTPVKINGKNDFIEYISIKDKSKCKNIKIENIKNGDIFYAVALPVLKNADDYSAFPVQSAKYYLSSK